MAKILLVEDNLQNKILVHEILVMNGHEIIEAKNGVDAVKAASSGALPDVILMDIQLPEMDGVTAMRIIKSQERTKNVPVLALTASAMKGDEEKLLGYGFDGYLAKPIDIKKLIEMVTESVSTVKGPARTI
ncbi:MAG: response regulator [Deltaproteobacteria bacterium]